ncbi:MAG: aldo/keto reductase [Thermoguttaceae bacterium]
MDRREFMTTLAAAGGLASAQFALAAEPQAEAAASPIPKRRLGRTGVEVTVLGLGGVVGMSRKPSSKFDPVQMAESALDAGITYFDTAPAYGNGQSEKNYGPVIARRRDEVFLATKTDQRSYDGAMRQVESSLKRLQTDHVDLIQIHNVGGGDDLDAWGNPQGVLRALQKLRDQKVTRFIGITGHQRPDVLSRAITQYDFDTILTTLNPTAKRRPFIEKLLPIATKKNMGILAMKVMGGGLGSLAKGNPIKNDGVARHDEAAQQATPAELIRYVLGLPISSAIIGMGSLEQLRENVAAARSSAPLDEPDRKALKARMSSSPTRP